MRLTTHFHPVLVSLLCQNEMEVEEVEEVIVGETVGNGGTFNMNKRKLWLC